MSEHYRILVTGGAGYLGSTMVPGLLSAGHSVTVLDNLLYKQSALFDVCANSHFNVFKGDIRDESLMKRLLRSTDVVIPLAALVGAPICSQDPFAATTVNRDAPLAMLKLMSRDQRLLMPTTNSGYGVGESGTFCDEDTPMRPVSLYGIHKVEVEQAALARDNTITFRLATVFGMSPRMRLDLLVNDFVYRAVHDRFVVLFEGHFKRNFVHVRDVTRVFMHGLANFENMKNEAYNVGLSDANLSKHELCARIRKHVPDFVFNEASVGEDPDKRDYIVSNAKIEKAGFLPRTSLDDGIIELKKGYTLLTNSLYSNV